MNQAIPISRSRLVLFSAIGFIATLPVASMASIGLMSRSNGHWIWPIAFLGALAGMLWEYSLKMEPKARLILRLSLLPLMLLQLVGIGWWIVFAIDNARHSM